MALTLSTGIQPSPDHDHINPTPTATEREFKGLLGASDGHWCDNTRIQADTGPDPEGPGQGKTAARGQL